MKKTLSRVRGFIKKKPWASVAVAAAVLLAGVWFFGLRGGGDGAETLVLEPQEFVQEVSVSGKVVAAQDVDLGFSTGGRVAHVYVDVGTHAAAGRVLAEVENGDLRAQILQKEAALEKEEASLASLRVGTRLEEISVAESTVASDRAALVDEVRDAYTTADDAVRNTTDQLFSNPSTNPSLKFTTSDSKYKANAELGRSAAEAMLVDWQGRLVGIGIATDEELAAAALLAQKNLATISNYLAAVNTALNTALTNQSVSQANINSWITDVGTARSTVNTEVSALTSAAADLDAAQKNLTLKRAGATAEDIQVGEAAVKAAQADLANAQALLRKTLIIAPFSGVITDVDAKVGQVATAGESRISMISGDRLQIESYVPEVNIALLEVGDSAEVVLDAYGEDIPFAARVISIDPAETVRDGVSTYRAVLQFAEQDKRIRAGMTANIFITTERKENVLSIPQGAVLSRGGKKYVRTKEGDTVVEKEVTTGGISSLGNIEILSGLSAGDVVVLSPSI